MFSFSFFFFFLFISITLILHLKDEASIATMDRYVSHATIYELKSPFNTLNALLFC